MTKPAPSPALKLAIDYGPLLVFFAVNFLAPAAATIRLVSAYAPFMAQLDAESAKVIARAIVATSAFVLATIVAITVSKVKLGSISPMLWISGGLVLVFGGLTIWFHDPRFIQMKPTFVYAILSGVLLVGLIAGKPLLERLMGSAYPGLSAAGWRALTRNWVIFFAAMAVLNEVVWRSTNWNFWVGYKLWGAIPLTFLFAIANVPMLMRHGLQTQGAPDTVPPSE